MKTIVRIFGALLLFAAPAFAQNNIEPPLITVTGQAEVRVPPDEVLFTLAVENVDKDMLVANQRTDASVKQILAIARKNNVKPEDVQTSQISVQPKYNTDDMDYEARNKVKRVLIGYEVSKTVAIRLRDISRFDELLADVLKAGITRLSNLQFMDSQIRKHRDEARRMAIRAAQEKAKLLAGEIGQAIGPAYSISEYTSDVGRVSATYQNATTAAGESSESESAIAPGSLSVTAQVTVRFRLQ
jgi:uncharacterized protein YggE